MKNEQQIREKKEELRKAREDFAEFKDQGAYSSQMYHALTQQLFILSWVLSDDED